VVPGGIAVKVPWRWPGREEGHGGVVVMFEHKTRSAITSIANV
jgi:hypothetical protein